MTVKFKEMFDSSIGVLASAESGTANTPNGEWKKMDEYRRVVVVFNIEDDSAGEVVCKLQKGDDEDGSSTTDITTETTKSLGADEACLVILEADITDFDDDEPYVGAEVEVGGEAAVSATIHRFKARYLGEEQDAENVLDLG